MTWPRGGGRRADGRWRAGLRDRGEAGPGLDALGPWLQPGRTWSCSGPRESQEHHRQPPARTRQAAHADVRAADQRGRHTTSQRELIPLPGGALLVDTPGLREVQLWAEGRACPPRSRTSKRSARAAASGTARTSASPAARAGGRRGGSSRPGASRQLSSPAGRAAGPRDPRGSAAATRGRARWKAIYKSLRHDPKGDTR